MDKEHYQKKEKLMRRFRKLVRLPIFVLSFLLLFVSPFQISAQVDTYNSEGYYYPQKEIILYGYQINHLDIFLNHYDNTRKAIPLSKPEVRLWLIEKKTKKDISIDFSNPIVKGDLIKLKADSTPVGKLVITGKFVDGKFKFKVFDHTETAVLYCDIQVFAPKGKEEFKNQGFTYWEGD